MQLRSHGITYDRTLALMTGAVQPEGVELEYVPDWPIPIFRRMFATDEFDAGEMSLGHFIILRARGDERFVGLPVFPSRKFRHDAVFVHVDAGIERPEDLRGRRVGIPDYLHTANFWVRAFLQHDYGVPPEAITWVHGRGEMINLGLPPNVRITDAPDGRDLSDMLEAGEIDAFVSPLKPACFEAGSPRVRRLFANFPEVETDYYRRTGHFPIIHLVVLRRRVYEHDRTVARRLYDAFERAKQSAYALLQTSAFLTSSLPFQVAHVEEARALLGDDAFPYGVARNRHTVGALARYVYEQGMTPREVSVEELFAPELLDT